MSDLLDFMKDEEPRFKLKIFKEDILQLIYTGYTYSQVLKYLREYKNIKVSESTLKRNITHFKKEEQQNCSRIELQRKEPKTHSNNRMSPEELKKKLERRNS